MTSVLEAYSLQLAKIKLSVLHGGTQKVPLQHSARQIQDERRCH